MQANRKEVEHRANELIRAYYEAVVVPVPISVLDYLKVLEFAASEPLEERPSAPIAAPRKPSESLKSAQYTFGEADALGQTDNADLRQEASRMEILRSIADPWNEGEI